MAEVQAVKYLDKVKLISHLLERRYSKQMPEEWNVGLNKKNFIELFPL